MNDPLTRALTEAATSRDEPGPPPPSIKSLNDVVPDLHDQIIDAVRLPFFDGGIEDQSIPVITHTLLETGSIRVSAHRKAPAYDVTITIDARTVKDAADALGRYEMLCAGHLYHSAHDRAEERQFSVPVAILEDGTFRLNVEAMRAEIATLITDFAKNE